MDQESSAHPGSFQARGTALIELNKLKTLCYPLSVIAVLGHSVGEATLAIACQVDRKTAHRWLVALTELGYLTRVRAYNGYILTPLAEAVIGKMLPICGEKVPTSVPFFPTIHQVTATGESPSSEITSPEVTTPSTDIPPDEFFVEKITVLRSCGIGEPKRSALARLTWVTPDFIDKWKTHLRGRGKLTPNLLIHCLEGRDPPPEPEPEKESVFDQVLKSDTPFSFLTFHEEQTETEDQ